MGQGINFPKINPEVNREEKKRSGLAGFLYRLGIGSQAGEGVGGVGGMGGLGGAGSWGGLLGSGGLLATKAGLIGLILVATTVAGSLGVVAYKLFGPTAADRGDASFSRLFAPKPQNAAGAAGNGASASANGASKSLQYLVDANAKGEAAPQDQSAQAASAAPANASASATVAPPLKNDNALGSTVAKLKTDHKLGGLSQGVAAGSGGSFSSPGGGANSAASLPASAKGGTLGGMPASRAGTGGGLSAARARALGSGAMRQLGAVRKDQIGAMSSLAAGHTYDGAAAPSSPAAAADGTSQPASQEASPLDQNPPINTVGTSGASYTVPSTVSGTNVTPWQAAINTASLAVMAAAMILFLASKISAMQTVSLGVAKAIICVLAVIAAALGAWVISLGSEIGGGKYGQPLQGQLLALAGGAIIAMAGVVAVGALGASSMDAMQTAMTGNTQLLMMVCGGAALAATAWAYLAPKKTYSASLFKDGWPPDWDHSYQSAQTSNMPSQGILDRYLA